jgi:ABC-type transport system involved in cytochrome c biogenesis permease subunit
MTSQGLILAGAGAYVAAFVVGLWRPSWAYALAAAGLVPHALAIFVRWRAQGHGPYFGLYDSLSSNLWLQLAAFLLFAWLRPAVRRAHVAAFGLCALLGVWLVFAPQTAGAPPPTFESAWFHLHVYAGKLSYALLFNAAMVALTDARRQNRDATVAYLMRAAFIGHTTMLLGGAAWGYAAWGGYWDWNTLEVWTLLTWLGFGIYFHQRPATASAPGRIQSWLAVAVYVFAVLTFYGVPFLSRASHQGLV